MNHLTILACPPVAGRVKPRLSPALRGATARAVVVNPDCPGISARGIDEAFVALETYDAVLGSTASGDFWLLGLSGPAPELFRDVPWGADPRGAATLERVSALGLRAARLETLADLDTPADIAALVGACARGRADACGPRTRDALRDMGLLP